MKTELLSERAVQLEKAVVENENTMKIHRELENQFAALQKKNFDYDSLLKVLAFGKITNVDNKNFILGQK